MSAKVYLLAYKVVCMQALLLQIIFISTSTALGFRWNDDLQRVVKFGDGFLEKPEDVCVDKKGTFYTVTRDGWVKRKHRHGPWENWKKLGGNSLLGVAIFADDVIQASDGPIYFSDVSTKYGLSDWTYDVLEGKPHGRLLKYNPYTGHTSIHLDHLSFPNGVALSRKQDFLVVCETWKCLKHWLKGKLKGNTSIFVGNLPGGPDNINLAPDGSFWIALVKLRTSGTKELMLEGVEGKAMVVKVNEDGKIIRKLDDSRGKKIVLKVSINCSKCKTQVLKAVTKLEGINSVAVDGEKGTVTVVGEVDPVEVTCGLRKTGKEVEIVSVGPNKPPEKPPEPSKPLPPCCNDCQLVAEIMLSKNTKKLYVEVFFINEQMFDLLFDGQQRTRSQSRQTGLAFGDDPKENLSFDREKFVSEKGEDMVMFLCGDGEVDPIFFNEDFDKLDEGPKFDDDG
ncbi:hypothetical protein Sjap_019679 [Stephania japonica]|uniref:HMA domain-containing protein n=1 Tax=Stephania japonica TaxID=461633 RepID=A0AAP0F1Y6_9MAGN